MSEKKLRRLPLAAAAMVACMSAQADYQSPDGNFRLSGFGTLGAVHSSTNDVDFVYPGQAGGAGTTWNTSPDSKVAVQGSYKFSPTVSVTTQVMTKYDANATYEPKVDWLFAKWQAMPAVSLRAGRMGAPFFMISDFRDVGYANTAIRPALDVYGQVPVSQLEGADATYQLGLGSTTVSATVYAGNSKADYASALRKSGAAIAPSSFELKALKGLNLTAEMDNGLTGRFGYMQGKISISSPSVTQLLSATGPGGPYSGLGVYPAISNAIEVDQDKISFIGWGLAYDQDNWVMSAEYTMRRSAKFVSNTNAWYANVGYRINKFTPYVGLSRINTKDDANKGNPLAAYLNITPANGTQTVLKALANNVQSLQDTQKVDQRTTTVGLRWDAMSNVAVKAQWDHVTKPADSYGWFFTKDPAAAQSQSFLRDSRRVNVLSLAVDVVF